MPSPGSDTLGKEMRSGNPGGSPFKSKFLQQYENDAPQNNSYASENAENNYSEHPLAISGGNTASNKTTENPDEAFMNMLRSDSNSRSNGPGWNDDVASISYEKVGVAKAGRRSVLKQKQTPVSANTNNSTNNNSTYSNNSNNSNNARRQHVTSPPTKPDWNLNTDIINTPMPYPPPKDESTVRAARSSLSLLKSKIRQTESAQSAARGDESGTHYYVALITPNPIHLLYHIYSPIYPIVPLYTPIHPYLLALLPILIPTSQNPNIPTGKLGRSRNDSMHSASSHDLRNGNLEFFNGRSTAPFKMESGDADSYLSVGLSNNEDDPFFHTGIIYDPFQPILYDPFHLILYDPFVHTSKGVIGYRVCIGYCMCSCVQCVLCIIQSILVEYTHNYAHTHVRIHLYTL